MIPVTKPDLPKPEWVKWHGDADTAIDTIKKLYKPGTKVTVDDVLYKRAMDFLLPLFSNKCAYCESLITNTHPGDVEHYRPKGRLKEIDGKIVKISLDGQEMDHPGYWWLCYEWRNLLPSCIDCNRRRNHTDEVNEGKIAAGKADIFPIDGKRAIKPDDPLPDESPLLLDPTEDGFDPEDHFEFENSGLLKTKSKRAQVSCDLLGLNLREELVKQRSFAFMGAANAVSTLVGFLIAAVNTPGQAPISDAEKANRIMLNDMWEGRTAHTAFVRRALRLAQAAFEKRGFNVEFPLPLN